jgi:fluoride ion exporter CrcB/FEX
MTALALFTTDAAAVAAGAVLGALSRYQAGEMAAQWIAKEPAVRSKFQGWHTAGINIAGSFALGSLAGTPTTAASVTTTRTPPAVAAPKFRGLSPRTKLMMGVGFCGSFTTFSTFSVDVVKWYVDSFASPIFFACLSILPRQFSYYVQYVPTAFYFVLLFIP